MDANNAPLNTAIRTAFDDEYGAVQRLAEEAGFDLAETNMLRSLDRPIPKRAVDAHFVAIVASVLPPHVDEGHETGYRIFVSIEDRGGMPVWRGGIDCSARENGICRTVESEDAEHENNPYSFGSMFALPPNGRIEIEDALRCFERLFRYCGSLKRLD